MNFPDHLKGKVKEMHESNYWANGKFRFITERTYIYY